MENVYISVKKLYSIIPKFIKYQKIYYKKESFCYLN